MRSEKDLWMPVHLAPSWLCSRVVTFVSGRSEICNQYLQSFRYRVGWCRCLQCSFYMLVAFSLLKELKQGWHGPTQHERKSCSRARWWLILNGMFRIPGDRNVMVAIAQQQLIKIQPSKAMLYCCLVPNKPVCGIFDKGADTPFCSIAPILSSFNLRSSELRTMIS